MNDKDIKCYSKLPPDNLAILHFSFHQVPVPFFICVFLFLIAINTYLHPYATISHHASNDWYYSYVGSKFALCKNISLSNDSMLVSLQRSLELRQENTVLLRFAVLLSFTLIIFALYCRSYRYAECNYQRGVLFKICVHTLWTVSMLQLISLALMPMFTIRLDADAFPLHSVWEFFIISTISSIGIYCALDLLFFFSHRESAPQAFVRLISFIIITITAPKISSNYDNYLQTLPCHSYVPLWMGISEYLFIMALLSFYGSIFYDFNGYEIVIWMDIDCDGTFNRSFTSSYEPSDNRTRWLPIPSSFLTFVQNNEHVV